MRSSRMQLRPMPVHDAMRTQLQLSGPIAPSPLQLRSQLGILAHRTGVPACAVLPAVDPGSCERGAHALKDVPVRHLEARLRLPRRSTR